MLKIDSALGLEFDGSRLVLAVVEKRLREYHLAGQLVVEDYAALSEAELGGRVGAFLGDNGFNRDNVIVGVPRDEVVVRSVELPLEVEDNLAEVVRFQVERFEPSPEESSCYDYAVAGRDLEQEKLRLQIVMVRSRLLHEYVRLVRQLGLEPRTVVFGSAGLAALLSAHSDSTVRKGWVLMLRRVERGWDLLACGPDRRIFCDHLPPMAADGPVEDLLAGMHQALRRWGLEQESFARLFVVGAPDELVGALRERVPEVEVLVGGLRMKTAGGAIGRESLAAAGLAVHGLQRKPPSRINLIPPAERVVAERAGLWPSAVLAGLLVLTLIGVGTRHFFQQSRLLEQVESELAQLQPSMQTISGLRDQLTAERQELEELRDLLRGRQVALAVLQDLTDRLPEDTYLSQLQLQDTSLSIQGFSDSASRLPTLLLDSPILEAIKTDYITQDPRVRGKDRFKFSATVKK